MNHIYRLVWSQVRRAWLVVSELASGRGKAGRTSRPQRLAWLAVLPLSLSPVPGMAMAAGATTSPQGGQVTAGSGHISQSGLTTTINQHSQNLSLNWQSFNVGAQSTVNFVQPNAQSIAVNRIADANGSVILGHLNANGQVFLINPNGVLFGQGAQVNVGGLVASTLDVSDRELGRGTLHFGGAGRGSVTNRGTLIAVPGGYVALLGHSVSNQGAIHAPAGGVALAGGSAVTLNFDGNRLLDMRVDASTLNALAENRQLIVADGGQVLMSAGAKDALLASVVNNTGTIQAQTVQNRAGKIVLLGGMAAGTTHVAGTLDASAPNSGDGGFIETSAAHVQVSDGTRISTLAAAGNNGSWLIDPQDFTIAPDKAGTVAAGTPSGDISGAMLTTALGSGNVTILSSQGSSAGSGNINVNDAVSWGANTLTLTAANNININAVMTASGSAGLALNTATANGTDAAVAGGTVNVMPGQGGRVDFTGSNNTLNINSQPYTIITALGAAGSATGTDLQGISAGLGGHYALGADIDAGGTANWNGNTGFAPLGNSGAQFTGTFDGLGHTINGLTIDRPSTDYIGLFGAVGTGSAIRNLGLLGGSVTGYNYVGALIGDNKGTISHAYATGAVSDASDDGGISASNYVGGLIGYNDLGTISQSHATGAVTGHAYVGGLVGYNYCGTIDQAYATGAVSASGINAGGLVGYNTGYNGFFTGGTISQAYATGAVSATDSYAGGLVGQNDFAGTISQAYATGAVSSGGYAGGLAGGNIGAISAAYATGAVSGSNKVGGLVGFNDVNLATISQAYATGAVSGSGNVGGLVGYGDSADVSNSYWDTESTGQPASAGGTGRTTALLQQLSTFAGWDISATGGDSSVWRIYEGHTAPLLRSFLTIYTVQPNFDGSGTALADIASVTLGDPKIFGATTGTTLTLTGLATGGGYIASSDADLSGLYSTQQGYDLIVPTGNASRTISTPGSAAGEVRLDNGATWTNGTLAIATTGNVTIVGALDGDALHLNSGGTITDTDALNVASFVLDGGNWQQVGSLSAFSATDFEIHGGNFLRALGGSGTTINPYQLTDLYGLQGVGTWLGNSFTLANDIDASGTAGWNSGAGFASIGGSTAFTGTFDGLGHTVGNLIVDSSTAYAGLFGTVGSVGTVKNVGLLGGSVTGAAAGAVGGLVGQNSSAITNAYASAAVSGGNNAQVGGLVGQNSGTITNAYATGAVSGGNNAQVGGLVGQSNNGLIVNAYATGAVSGTGYVGGLVGYDNSGTITYGYWDTETTGQITSAGGGTGLTTTALIAAMPAGFHPSVWANADNLTTPYLIGLAGNQVFNVHDLPTGTVTATHRPNLYTAILDVNQLQAVGVDLTGRYVLGNDIDASATVSWNSGAGFAPIGDYTTRFTGIIDGLSHTISGLTIDRPGIDYVGLLGVTDSGSAIRNLGLLGGSVTGHTYIGGLVGWSHGGTISQTYATGAVSGGGDFVGGLVGFNDGGTVSQAYAIGTVGGGSYVGGLVGVNNGTISQAYATGAVSGNGLEVGGLVGENDGTVSQAYATGAVHNTGSDVGGLVGGNFGTISQAYATGAVSGINVGGLVGGNFGTISQAYATGALSGSSKVGGLVGYFVGGTTTNGYWDTETTGRVTSDGGTGLTTAQMMDPASFAAWGTDASTVGGSAAAWRIYAGDTMPLLRAFMTGLTVTGMDVSATYNGIAFAGSSGVTFGTLTPSYWLPSTSLDSSLVLGNTSTSTSTPAINAGNYTLDGGLHSGQMGYDIDLTAGTLTIGQAALTISSSSVGKTYDGGLGASGAAVVSSGTLFGSDTISGGNFAFTDKNVGTGKRVTVAGVTVSDGNSGGNYAVTYVDNTTSTVTALGVTVDATGTDRVYDGSTVDAVSLDSSGILPGDTVNFSGIGAFGDKNVGTGKAVAVSGISAGGIDAGNYTFNTTAATTADISPYVVDLGGSRVYDGSTAAAAGILTFGPLVGSETLALSGSGGVADKHVGNGKAFTLGTLVLGDGTGLAGNYTLSGGSNTIDITRLAVTADASGTDRAYDGTTSDAVSVTSAGILTGDDVSFTGIGHFADKNVGTAKAVAVSGIGASGIDAGNYSFNTIAATTADISPYVVDLGGSRVYDGGTAAAAGILTFGPLVGSETLTLSGSGALADKNVGNGKAFTLGTLAL
ncbi:MAG TPA: YDG domain-containing protein, partial [Rhodanobacter sp.]|nr:YDG domain-containing protein [Rhodanobacter sp.]